MGPFTRLVIMIQTGRVPKEYLPSKKLLPVIKPFPEVPWSQKLNLSKYLIDRNVEGGRGNKIAILYEDRKITYDELEMLINKFGNSLNDVGIRNGDRVLLRAPNIPEFIVGNFAIQKIGAITVPVMVLLKARTVIRIANQTEAKAIVVHSEFMDEVEKAKGSFETIENILVIGGKAEELREKGYLSYEELAEKGGDKLEGVDIDCDEVTVIHYTSGTTGLPKGCIHTPSSMLGTTYFFAKDGLHIREDDVIGGFPTMAFTFGHGGLSVIPFLFGATTSLIKMFTPEKMLETIDKHKISILFSVPTAYRKMLEAIPKYDLSSLRVLATAGEAMEPSLYNNLKKLLPQVGICEHLGCTEAFHAICSAKPGKAKPGSFGVPVTGFEVKIFDDKGRECPPRKHGHFAFIGPTGFRYWRSPEEQKKAVRNGWNYTGDIAYKDEDGFFWFVSRHTDTIKSAAYRISPYEVEKTLAEHPAIFETACIGAPDPVKGEIVKAFITIKEGCEPSDELANELKEFVERRIGKFKVPRKIEFVKELPKTETGKILRRELRRREWAKQSLRE